MRRFLPPALMTALLGLGGAVAAGAAWAAPPRRPACPGCDVVLILIDVLRADELMEGGAKRKIMPHLDELASRGVFFMNAYSPSPHTTPAQVSIMTGLYPWHSGVLVPLRDRERRRRLALQPDTLANTFSRLGYDKSSLNLDDLSGLKRFIGERSAPPLGRSPDKRRRPFFLLLRGAVHDPFFPAPADVRALSPKVSPDSYPSAEDVTKCMVAALTLRKPPSCPRIGFTEPPSASLLHIHESIPRFMAADPARRLGAIRETDPPRDNYILGSCCFWSFFSSETARTTARLLYDASAMEADRKLGARLSALRRAGLLKNAVVLAASQHGEEFLEHGTVTHAQDLYTESLRIPLILAAPNGPSGKSSPRMASLVDVLPTLMGTLGGPLPGRLDGVDLLAPRAEHPGGRRYVFSSWNDSYAVRDRRFTYLRKRAKGGIFKEILFNRQEDPRETTDIARRNPKDLARLREALLGALRGAAPLRGDWPPGLTDKERGQIKRMGYW